MVGDDQQTTNSSGSAVVGQLAAEFCAAAVDSEDLYYTLVYISRVHVTVGATQNEALSAES